MANSRTSHSWRASCVPDLAAIIAGLREFLAEQASERAIGDQGYLVAIGLVPIDSARARAVATAGAGTAADRSRRVVRRKIAPATRRHDPPEEVGIPRSVVGTTAARLWQTPSMCRIDRA